MVALYGLSTMPHLVQVLRQGICVHSVLQFGRAGQNLAYPYSQTQLLVAITSMTLSTLEVLAMNATGR
jgi:hypothetical protein